MPKLSILPLICWLIAGLALIAAGTGVLWQGGAHFDFTNLRGQPVQIWGGGLYHFDSVSGASQEIAQDLITLVLGIPLLIGATVWAGRGALRGQLLRAGTLGYFLYTYTSMSMLTAYNPFFLLYVALMSLSLFGFILALRAIDVAALPARFGARFPRRTIAGFTFFLGAMLLLLWLGRIVPPLLAGTAPDGLDAYSTLVIQALDLGVIAPAAVVTGALLLRRDPFGYLLASVVLMLGGTMGAALVAMGVGQVLAGVAVSAAEFAIFTALAAANAVLGVLLLRSIVAAPAPSARPLSPLNGRAPTEVPVAAGRR